MSAAAVEWSPGDPLHDVTAGTRGHGGYLFNFRDDLLPEVCHCADAAHWSADPTKPLPASARPIYGEDELSRFIAEHRAWVEAGRP